MFLLPCTGIAQNISGPEQRQYLVKTLTHIADPVLNALSKNELKTRMPIEAMASVKDRANYTYLEAFGRLFAGMAPWLELGVDDSPEGKLREKYMALVVKCIQNATDPKAADFMNFKQGRQPLVDAAFFAQGLIRAPKVWELLNFKTKENVLTALKSSRVITPSYSNWLMFSAEVEAALQKYDSSGDMMRIDYAVKQHLLWYKGDGSYGDGPNYHWDYYNSFVIQPMLIDVLDIIKDKKNYDLILTRARRYAAVQERLISPEGTYPPVGRSLAYRFGAFQVLSQIALMKALPQPLSPEQVRYALYTLIKKQVEAPGTFDQNGWLQIGFYGHQPKIGESYISTGSLYLCSEAFLILGLSPTDVFWQGPNRNWTSRKAWSGEDIEVDHAITDQ